MTDKSPLSDNAGMLDKTALADRLKEYRASRAWSQKQMGAVLGLDKSTVCKMESGSYIWTPLTIGKLLKKIPDLMQDNNTAA